MKKAYFIFLILCSLAIYACSTQTTGADAINRAESAINAGEHTLAQQCADSLLHDHGDKLSMLTPSQLCRLALVYKKLADNTLSSEDANTATALNLYKMAFSINADSVIVFRRSLTLDDAAAFEVLSSLQAMADYPADLEAEEPTDSIGLAPEPYDQSATSH